MSEGLEQQVPPTSLADVIPVVIGVAVFAWWLLTTSLGRKALAHSKPRRTSMIFLTPFAVFFAWLAGTATLANLAALFTRRLQAWQGVFLTQLAGTLGSLVVVVLVLVVARMTFVRGLKGLGLRLATLPKDLVHAFLTLAAVWPLVMAMMSLTMLVMRQIDPEFEVPQHEALEIITGSSSMPLQILMIVLAVAIAPLVEEMIFRGLFQTMIRSYLDRPWVAIAITSVLFSAIHANSEHWPALFVLALGLGYCYEKSGSLWRPIFMHAMFNGVTIAAALAASAMA